MGSCPQRFAYPPESRLKKRRDYKRIQGRGRKIWGQRFIYMIARGKTTRTRLGITVSRKVGNAVKRNRIKRWIREVFRKHPDLFVQSIDIVVVAKRNIDDFSYDHIQSEFIQVIGKFMRGEANKSSRHSTIPKPS